MSHQPPVDTQTPPRSFGPLSLGSRLWLGAAWSRRGPGGALRALDEACAEEQGGPHFFASERVFSFPKKKRTGGTPKGPSQLPFA